MDKTRFEHFGHKADKPVVDAHHNHPQIRTGKDVTDGWKKAGVEVQVSSFLLAHVHLIPRGRQIRAPCLPWPDRSRGGEEERGTEINMACPGWLAIGYGYNKDKECRQTVRDDTVVVFAPQASVFVQQQLLRPPVLQMSMKAGLPTLNSLVPWKWDMHN